MARSQQFSRRADNDDLSQGLSDQFPRHGRDAVDPDFPALDRLHADVDVDYRSPAFPVSMFNGHLTASNSDVRAGNNYDRHAREWNGLPNWWRSFFGIRVTDPEPRPGSTTTTFVRSAAGRQEADRRHGRRIS